MAKTKKLTQEQKAAAALELIEKFDFKLLKKQREHIILLSESGALPKKTKDVLDGIDNGLYELASFACDVLGQKETDVLMVEPEHKSQAASERWNKVNNKRWENKKQALIKDIKKKISKL